VGSLLAGIMIICSISLLYEETLFEWSLEIMPKLMADTSPGAFKALKFYSSIIGGGNFQACFVAAMILFRTDIETIMVMANSAIVISLTCAMKLYHSSPRPSWISPEIHSYKCYNEFANPSGHTLCCTYQTIYMFFIYVYYTDNTLVYRVFGRIFPPKAI
jgi:hypothetical protein